MTTLHDTKTGKTTLSRNKTLVDVNENKDLGSVFQNVAPPSQPLVCAVEETACTSTDAWDAAAKPFMAD
jgi:hypothetical protein